MSRQAEARRLADGRDYTVDTRRGVVSVTVTCKSWDDAADLLLAFREKGWTARYGPDGPTVEAHAKP